MTTKRSEIIGAYNAGNYKKALKIASKFTRDFNKEQQRIIQIAYESTTGKESFYMQLGIDTQQIYRDALELIYNTYIK